MSLYVHISFLSADHRFGAIVHPVVHFIRFCNCLIFPNFVRPKEWMLANLIHGDPSFCAQEKVGFSKILLI